MIWVLCGLFLFLILNCVDVVLTNSVISHGGKEFNPIIKYIYSKFGVVGIVFFKAFIITILFIQGFYGYLSIYTIWYFCFLYTVILIMMYLDIKKCNAKIIGIKSQYTLKKPEP